MCVPLHRAGLALHSARHDKVRKATISNGNGRKFIATFDLLMQMVIIENCMTSKLEPDKRDQTLYGRCCVFSCFPSLVCKFWSPEKYDLCCKRKGYHFLRVQNLFYWQPRYRYWMYKLLGERATLRDLHLNVLQCCVSTGFKMLP